MYSVDRSLMPCSVPSRIFILFSAFRALYCFANMQTLHSSLPDTGRSTRIRHSDEHTSTPHEEHR